jgi:hypothetical protein
VTPAHPARVCTFQPVPSQPVPSQRSSWATERRNPRTLDIDRQSSLDLLRTLHAEDALVPEAVAEALPRLALAVDLAVTALGAGGRVHYFGAGTSGRLALLDVAEVGTTYALRWQRWAPRAVPAPPRCSSRRTPRRATTRQAARQQTSWSWRTPARRPSRARPG